MQHSQARVYSLLVLLGIVLAALVNPARAQTAYKCGNTYSQTPCPGGAQIDTADLRTTDQKNASAKVTRDSERVVEQLANERKGRERNDRAVSTEASLGIIEKPKQAKVTRSKAIPIMVKQPKALKSAKKKNSKLTAQPAEVVKPGRPAKPSKPKKPTKAPTV